MKFDYTFSNFFKGYWIDLSKKETNKNVAMLTTNVFCSYINLLYTYGLNFIRFLYQVSPIICINKTLAICNHRKYVYVYAVGKMQHSISMHIYIYTRLYSCNQIF